MNYKYRVTLKGIKGFFRLYSVPADASLYKFHKQLQCDLEFPTDQQILFKAFAEDGSVAARYALVDLGKGTVDKISIKQTITGGIVSFEYFYDTISKKSVIITLEGEADVPTSIPMILETKGPLPIDFENGYVAFEDLPVEHRNIRALDDDDSDEDSDDGSDEEDSEEDSDDKEEEEEQIYVENE